MQSMKLMWVAAVVVAAVGAGYLVGFRNKQNLTKTEWENLLERRRSEFTMRITQDCLPLIDMLDLGNSSTMKYLGDFDTHGAPFQIGARGVVVGQQRDRRLATWEIRAKYQGMKREPSYLVLDVDLKMTLVRKNRQLARKINKYVVIDQTGLDAKQCGTKERGGVTMTTFDIAPDIRRVRFESAWPPAMLMTTPQYDRGYSDVFYREKLPDIYGLLCTHVLTKGVLVAFEPPHCGQPVYVAKSCEASGFIFKGQQIIGLVRVSGSESSTSIATVECFLKQEEVLSDEVLKESKLDTEFKLADGINYTRRSETLSITIGATVDLDSVSEQLRLKAKNAPSTKH